MSTKAKAYVWRAPKIFEAYKLYGKHGFYKSLLFSTIFYPIPVLLKLPTINIRKYKNRLLRKEVVNYLDKKKGIKVPEVSGPFALMGLVEIFLMRLYDFFDVTKNDTVYDLGATVGEYSLKCAKMGANVVAVELEEDPYLSMKKNITANKFEQKIIPFNCRVDGKENSIDAFAKKTNTIPTIIKMDIEGDEEKALEGAKNTLRKHKPKIILETHSKKLEEGCMSILGPEGYRILKKIDMGAKNKETNLLFVSAE